MNKIDEQGFERYFSSNALDGGDIDHPGTMIAPSLAFEVAKEFIDQHFISKRDLVSLLEEMQINPRWDSELYIATALDSTTAPFDKGVDFGNEYTIQILRKRLSLENKE